jgi:hypothetical protein
MEINRSEAMIILQAHRIEVSDMDPRSPIQIATQYVMTGQVALQPVPEQRLDSVARIQAEIAWPRLAEATSRVGSLS